MFVWNSCSTTRERCVYNEEAAKSTHSNEKLWFVEVMCWKLEQNTYMKQTDYLLLHVHRWVHVKQYQLPYITTLNNSNYYFSFGFFSICHESVAWTMQIKWWIAQAHRCLFFNWKMDTRCKRIEWYVHNSYLCILQYLAPNGHGYAWCDVQQQQKKNVDRRHESAIGWFVRFQMDIIAQRLLAPIHYLLFLITTNMRTVCFV